MGNTVDDNVPSEGRRIEQVRERLFVALGPKTSAESEVIRYVSRAGTVDAGELLADMIERALIQSTSDAYNRGYSEGSES